MMRDDDVVMIGTSVHSSKIILNLNILVFLPHTVPHTYLYVVTLVTICFLIEYEVF